MFNPATRILIVDDMMTMRKLVKKALAALGYTDTDEADDGQKAWSKISEVGNFGLVVSDWNMPNCSGIDLLKRVRGDKRFKDLPFVLLTAEGEVHQVKEAMISGVDGYVLKPFTPESLKKALEACYKKRTG